MAITCFILRIGKLEEMLKGLDKEVDIFKMKEKMTLEESKINVEKLNKISVSLEAAVKEIEVCAWNCVLKGWLIAISLF